MNSMKEKEDTGKSLRAYKSLQHSQSQRKVTTKKIQQAQTLTNMTAVYIAPMWEKPQKRCVEMQRLTLYNMTLLFEENGEQPLLSF